MPQFHSSTSFLSFIKIRLIAGLTFFFIKRVFYSGHQNVVVAADWLAGGDQVDYHSSIISNAVL